MKTDNLYICFDRAIKPILRDKVNFDISEWLNCVLLGGAVKIEEFTGHLHQSFHRKFRDHSNSGLKMMQWGKVKHAVWPSLLGCHIVNILMPIE